MLASMIAACNLVAVTCCQQGIVDEAPETRPGEPTSAYVTLPLRDWMSIDIPAIWRVRSDVATGTIAALMEAHGLDASETLEGFSAYLQLPETGQIVAGMSVRFYPDATLPSNALAAAIFTAQSIETDFDPQMRRELERALSLTGAEMTDWRGSRIEMIDGAMFVVTSYTRDNTSAGGDISDVYLHRHLDGERSFTVTTRCRTTACPLVDPILQHIQQSIDLE